MKQGKVWLVGAGPSNSGLLTIRGKKALAGADVVIYDRLAGTGILSIAPEGAEFINAGKKAGNHIIPQQEINQLLLKKALEGKRVVRLKGGDPFLFGRGGEELELLQKEGIPFEIVPGITSALAVPAYNGIPATHREYCSSVHILTGQGKDGEPDINYKALVQAGGTLIFLMGVSALGRICDGLRKAGMDPQMPAALLERGTTSKQRKIIGDISSLEEKALREQAQAPAIILVGKVCGFSEKLSWFEKQPLSGITVAITRPKERIEVLRSRLEELGAEILELPAIDILPVIKNEKLEEAICHLEQFTWLVFTSPAGVRIFFEQMKSRKRDIRALNNVSIAAIGTGTAKELEEKGIYPELMPEVFDTIHLGNALAKVCAKGDKILIPRSDRGNKELIRILRQAGAKTEDIPLYHTEYKPFPVWFDKKEIRSKIDYVMFASASEVEGFVHALGGSGHKGMKAVCIGEQTGKKAFSFGMDAYIAREAAISSMIEKLLEIHKNGKDMI